MNLLNNMSLLIGGIGIYSSINFPPLILVIILSEVSIYQKTILSVKKDLLLAFPYHPNLGITIRMSYHGVFALLVWNCSWFILLFFGCCCCINSPRSVRYLGVILMLLAELASTATCFALMIMTRDILPKPVNRCNNSTTWEHSPEYPTIFQVLAEVDQDKTRNEMYFCHTMVRIWIYEVALSAIGGLRAIILVSIWQRETIERYMWHGRPVIRFAHRWLLKWKDRKGGIGSTNSKLEFEVKSSPPCDLELGIRNPRTMIPLRPLSKSPSRTSALTTLLSNPEIISTIALNLHHCDILSVHLLNKGTNRILTKHKHSQTIPSFRSLTCEKGSKSSCYACGTQICSQCTCSAVIPEPEISSHLHRCKPCCSSCFYTQLCHHPHPKNRYRYSSNWERTTAQAKNPTWVNPPQCQCSRVRAEGVKRDVCKNCERRTMKANMESRERRERAELMHLEMQDLLCLNEFCQRTIRGATESGVRWWVCTECKGECVQTGVHLSWMRR
ncbi:hypothetical protein BDZ91DRAFT_742063 [Kalaharituber pfeilii]|nr:hypothetical protein BDZ91DRAFT_742063 [Kalaharituber pfeilii]